MHKLKSLLALFLVLSLLFMLPMNLYAQTAPAQVNFVASALDSSSNITVTMSISNATFNAFQFAIRYDPVKLQPIDKSTKLATNRFNEFTTLNSDISSKFSTIGTDIDHSLGLIDFSLYLTPGESFSYETALVERAAIIGNTPLIFYTFYFKVLDSSQPMFELAKEDSTKPYRVYLPNGGGLANAGQQISSLIRIDFSALQKTVIEDEYINPNPSTDDTSQTPNHETSPPENQNEPIIKRPSTSLERLTDTLVLQIGNYAAAKDGALCHIYPGEKLVTPYIKNQRTFVPIRFIAEKLGMEVTWNDTAKTVTFIKGSDVLTLTIGEKQYQKNGVTYSIDTAAELQWSRTMVPIRFVAEALGHAVEWNSQLNMVYITKSELPWLLEDPVEKQATNDVALVISPLLRDFV